MGISRDNWHKRRKTGGKRKPYHKKRKYELGRPAANTKIGPRRIHTVRVRGGNKKYRALRLDVGNFSWGSECCTRKTRIIDVVYNASNNELVRTKTLVKNCIVLIDSTPYRQWYESHYALPLGRKKGAKLTPEEEEILNKKRSKKIQKKYDERKKNAKISSLLEEQFQQGKLLGEMAVVLGAGSHRTSVPCAFFPGLNSSRLPAVWCRVFARSVYDHKIPAQMRIPDHPYINVKRKWEILGRSPQAWAWDLRSILPGLRRLSQ
ncbi:40S ribosomal protein S8 isoform X1 [Carlito syrichta]|uniref:40S ribosomal protein S8 n=10 Tax=cellular organisms TaxID=131567 RepID=A0A3Q0EFL4_CARSF|nr:40S ribosomal protein S8 isoform X1 [Carlito syrichta]